MSSTTASGYFERAERKFDQGDYRGAIADYDEALRIKPDDAVAFYNRGCAKDELKDYRGAIADYTEALRIKADYAVAFYNRGFAKKELGDYRGAIADYDEALRIEPDDAVAFRNRGFAKRQLGDYRGAIADYDEALRIKPDDAVAFHNRGYAKDELKDYRGAIADYTEALRIKADYHQAFYNRGVAKNEQGDYRGAIADYTEALRIKPDFAIAFFFRGFAKKELGDYRGAIADYDEALRIKPDDELAFHCRGYAKKELGDYRGAIADYDEALRIKPDYWEVFYLRGVAKEELGDYRGAIADYDEALRIKPNYARCFQHRGSAKKELGDLSGAFEDYTQALRLYPAAIAKGEDKAEERLREAEAEFAELKRERRAAAERKAAEEQRQVKEARRHLEAKRRAEAERRAREEREEKERREREEAERSRIEAERRARAAAERERIACERRRPPNVFAAVKSGNLEPLTILLREGYDFNIRHPSGKTLLHAAILSGKTKVALWLINNAKLDLEAVSKENRNALHYAAIRGNLVVAETLVKRGANIFVQDGLDQTARDLAVENRRVAIAALLKREMKKGSAASGTPSSPSGSGSGSLLPPTPTGGAGAGSGGRPKTPEPEVRADGVVGISLTIPFGELRYGLEIGSGGFGKVLQGKWGDKDVAIKELLYQRLSPKAIANLQKEAAKMVQLRMRDPDARVVHLYGICTEPTHFGLVMELMPRGSLYDLLQSGANIPWSTRWSIATDVVNGLQLIHREGMLHRDLKSLNVLLDGNLRAKISDFGLSEVKAETKSMSQATPSVGTMGWMAPEIFGIRPKYSVKSDVYAYGMVLWELTSRELPYKGVDPLQVMSAIKAGEREEIPDDTPREFAKLITTCWAQRAADRPTSSQLALTMSSLASQGIFAVGGGAGAAAGVSVAPASTGRDYAPL